MLERNTKAPDFSLKDENDANFTLSEEMGKQNIVLVFYPFDWSPVCSSQLALYSQMKPLFDERNAKIVGISVDSRFCHAAFKENSNLKVTLLADFEPKGAVSELYGAYNKEGHSSRALYVLNTDGTIVWDYLSPEGENPGADGIFHALDIIQTQIKENHV
jgi:peroxiredoxin